MQLVGWPPWCRPLVLLAQAVDGVLAAALDRLPFPRGVLLADEAPQPALGLEAGENEGVLVDMQERKPEADREVGMHAIGGAGEQQTVPDGPS